MKILKRSNQRGIIHVVPILVLVLIAVGITMGAKALQTTQNDIRSQAQVANPQWAFEEAFGYGAPTAPSQTLLPRNFDYLSTHRAHAGYIESMYSGLSYPADHGEDCVGPPLQHTVTSGLNSNSTNPETSFFYCNGHMMSSLGDVSGYSVSTFYPRQEFDFAQGGVMEFDSNINPNPGRSWWEVHIVPKERLNYGSEEEARSAEIMLRFNSDTGRIIAGGGNDAYDNTFNSDTDPARTDRKIRRRHRLEIQQNRLTWGIQQADGSFRNVSTTLPNGLPITRGVPVFEVHAYTPEKANNNNIFTYHWDNIRFTGPKLPPIEGYEADQVMNLGANGDRRIGDTQTQTITLARVGTNPAIVGQFNGLIAGQGQLSINGGPNIDVRPHTPANGCYYNGWRTFRVPIDPSVLKVGANTFKWTVGPRGCSSGSWSGYAVKAFEVQMDGVGGVQTTSVPTATAVPTAPVTSTPTSTPGSVPTTTPTPRPTSVPTPVPTSSGQTTFTITSPASGATVADPTVTVNYQLTGDQANVDHIHYRVDNGPEQTEAIVDGRFSVSLANGSHTITAYIAMRNPYDQPMPGTQVTRTFTVGQPTGATPTPIVVATATPQPVSTWTASYYRWISGDAAKGLTGTPLVTRSLGSNLDLNWRWGSPAGSVPRNNFSARFTKQETFAGGTYRFTIRNDDGVRVYVDGQLITSDATYWRDQAASTRTVQTSITPGAHTVTVEYYENRGRAQVAVNWIRL